MPEANVLFSVTAVVVVGLVAWVAVVLKTTKEPWSRQPVPQPRTQDLSVEGDAVEPAKAADDAKVEEPADDAKAEPADDAKAEDAAAKVEDDVKPAKSSV